MEKQEQDSIQAFDTLYTTNQIQILKILLPYCAPDIQRNLAVMIRFLELQYTIFFVRSHPKPSAALRFLFFRRALRKNQGILSSCTQGLAGPVSIHTERHADV